MLPDGSNLPPGSGTPAQGAPIYSQKCAMCHGDEGRNPRPGYSPMVGAQSWPNIDSPKTITYYEHATTHLRHHPPGDAVSDAAHADRR